MSRARIKNERAVKFAGVVNGAITSNLPEAAGSCTLSCLTVLPPLNL
jgi:hypothetical protein